ncbi:MAG: branched-chain amino acid ABC transporter permease [Deltaproteobacteria bacterium]|nr:MAG: branched-chain amino acid ABC transporter permease [Deltaproteobacteria bacterium]
MTRRRAALAAAAFGLCLLVPLVVEQDYQLKILFRVFTFAALGLAWNLVGGYAGQLSLGHAAYFGIGAYSLALFPEKLGAPIPVAIVLGVVAAMAAAFVIGRVSFRLRGPYFALATIAFGEILRHATKNLHSVTGGDIGVQPPALFARDPSRWFYVSAVVLTALALAVTVAIVRSRFGYQLQAIREDEDTAMACGIDAARTKLVALVISAALTAVAGALWASQFLFIDPDSVLATRLSEQIAIVAMLGGAGTLTGPIVGAIVLVPAEELFKNVFEEAHLLIYGVLIVVVVLFLPEGIVGTVARWWPRLAGPVTRWWRRTRSART